MPFVVVVLIAINCCKRRCNSPKLATVAFGLIRSAWLIYSQLLCMSSIRRISFVPLLALRSSTTIAAFLVVTRSLSSALDLESKWADSSQWHFGRKPKCLLQWKAIKKVTYYSRPLLMPVAGAISIQLASSHLHTETNIDDASWSTQWSSWPTRFESESSLIWAKLTVPSLVRRFSVSALDE